MKRMFIFLAIVFAWTGSAFSTTFEECFSLGSYFGLNSAVVHEKISFYEEKLKSDPSDYYANLAIGILYDTLASPGDKPEKDANKKSIEYSEKFLKKEPNNPLALIYNGLAYGLVGRDSKNPIVKLSSVNKSSAICDKAVKNTAGNSYEWYIRFLRANYYANLPDFFKKRKIAESDYQFIEDTYNKNPSIEYVMSTVYFYLGEMEKSKGNLDKAVEYWKKSVAMNDKHPSNSYEARTAKKRLETFTD